ncbi:shikimate dehydrogenase [Thermodesulfovibrio yellowstonii]|uniref:Shikimate dehydrogenase (NADP(+)) n=1 Tax=Thermodesulfovibrio yellowstonii TaxID=28262 RepID=A0A9W6LKG2_9BACT|nr:shikimate dehydrogenase [Thermodesulfovibrio islandicus]GLI54211.1 shikimate dehydrogenase (NADP(+)) [Thermodesulfovibrio islandicus]
MITGKTKIIGIFGDPIEHTLSPLIHNEAFSYLGLDYCYVAFNVKKDKLKEAVEGIRALNIKGVNITVPHKETVIQYIDELSDEAKNIGAVNTILNNEEILKGFNTDVNGFILSLKDKEISIKNKNFLILGAGGAAKAIVYGILKEGGKVYIYNRTPSKALAIKEKFKKFGFIEIVEMDKSVTEKIDVIVNATSLGLKKDDPMPLNPELIKPEHVYCDIVYPETPLIREAERIGCKVVGGIGMLLWQAAFAFKIWTEVEAPIEIMKKTLNKLLTKD